MATAGTMTIKVVAIIDQASVANARETLAAELGDLIPDPVALRETVDRIMATAPLVRYIATPG